MPLRSGGSRDGGCGDAVRWLRRGLRHLGDGAPSRCPPGFKDDSVKPFEAALDARVVRSHQERRPGWRGVLDFVLRRKPLTVIDEVDLYSVDLVPREPS